MSRLANGLLFSAIALLPLPATGQIPAAAGGNLGFYRHPAIHGDVVVFAAEGDLWRVPPSGGVATRITTPIARQTGFHRVIVLSCSALRWPLWEA